MKFNEKTVLITNKTKCSLTILNLFFENTFKSLELKPQESIKIQIARLAENWESRLKLSSNIEYKIVDEDKQAEKPKEVVNNTPPVDIVKKEDIVEKSLDELQPENENSSHEEELSSGLDEQVSDTKSLEDVAEEENVEKPVDEKVNKRGRPANKKGGK